jgi:MoaA/NifB/PqqE/SkfB family radical SAM enzyme
MRIFDYNEIDEYQIEITTYCNASCPQCPRNLNGYGINPYLPLVHLSRETIDKAFDIELCSRLRQIFFCGSYGDPIMHPNFLDILKDFRSKNPTLWIYVHTNGGVHEKEYWREIAEIMNGYGQIDFGIDGLEDTLHLYRKNVKYHKVIENAKSYIDAGGRAQWNYIVFKHNEHQVEEAKELSKTLGFYNILVRNTGRFFNHNTIEEMDHWPVYKKENKLDYYLEVPTNDTYKNKSMKLLPNLKKEYKEMKIYFDTTPIKCDALAGIGKKVAINADGLVLPCNLLNHNLYDARFRDNSLPGANVLSTIDEKNQVRTFLEKYGFDNLNINYHTLTDIFLNPFWEDLVASWTNENRLFECAMSCGNKLSKVWDQGGSIR